jgi:hypothetical protein
VDKPAPVPDGDQTGSVRWLAAAASGEAQPFFHRYAGVMQIDERIGGFCILETDRMRLKMLIHRQVNSLSIMFRKGLN